MSEESDLARINLRIKQYEASLNKALREKEKLLAGDNLIPTTSWILSEELAPYLERAVANGETMRGLSKKVGADDDLVYDIIHRRQKKVSYWVADRLLSELGISYVLRQFQLIEIPRNRPPSKCEDD